MGIQWECTGNIVGIKLFYFIIKFVCYYVRLKDNIVGIMCDYQAVFYLALRTKLMVWNIQPSLNPTMDVAKFAMCGRITKRVALLSLALWPCSVHHHLMIRFISTLNIT